MGIPGSKGTHDGVGTFADTHRAPSRRNLRRMIATDAHRTDSLSAIDINSLRFVLDMVSKDLISLLTGLPKFTWSGTLGADGFPSPWKSNW
jgi:hypothetical protein